MKTSLKSSLLTFFTIASFAVLTSSCNDNDTPPPTSGGTIPAVIEKNDQLSVLDSALAKADLVDTLGGSGPFTLFAPTNEAFTKSGITNLDSLSANDLKPILTSHVLSGEVKSADIQSGMKSTANLANNIYFSKNAEGLFINGNIRVLSTDVSASNGVIHTIDGVITPPGKSLIQLVAGDTDYSELVALVSAADTSVVNALSAASQNGLTVFAPSNAAVTAWYQVTPKDSLLAPANKAMLTSVLLYHVLPGRVFSTDLPNVNGEVDTVNPDNKVTFDLSGGTKVVGTTSGASNITSANILGTNGVIHKIDKVLIP